MVDTIVGEIRLAGFETVPDGWASCDGQLLSIREYPELFAAIGTTYGGNGRTTFALPDLRGRVALHASEDSYALGTSGGASRHALTLDELPAHQHELTMAASAPSAGTGGAHTPVVTSVAGELLHPTAGNAPVTGAGHDNMQPYLGLVFMIALGS
jgi:microcystin-dependent protein